MRVMHVSVMACVALLGTLSIMSALGPLHTPSPRSPPRQAVPVMDAPPERRSPAPATGTPSNPYSVPCTALPTNDTFRSVFTARLCFDEGRCAGHVEVTVARCEDDLPALLSNNKSLSTFLKAMGADTIRVRVAGPEVVAGMMARHATRPCTYRYPLRLTRQGHYNLALERLYSRGSGLNEAFSEWPQMLQESVLPVDAPASHYHFQQRTLESTVFLKCRLAAPPPRPTTACTGFEERRGGRWVVVGAGPVYTRVRVRKIQRSPIVFEWALAKEPHLQWLFDSCTHARPPPATVLAGLAGKRIVVVGDSQLRALYFGLANVLAGQGVRCVQNISSAAAEPAECIANVKGSHRKRFGHVQVDFFDDLFLDRFASQSKFDGYDVLIVGFGQHPASKEHWPLDRYRAALEARRRKVQALQALGRTVIWYLCPQYPHTVRGYPVVVRDWRTDPRLSLFNAEASRRMIAAGVPVVDAFEVSTPMAHTSPDQAHFSNFVSYEIVQVLLAVICAKMAAC